MDKREYAKYLMVHYFKTVWPDGKVFYSDNRAELELLVDAIVDAAVEHCRDIRYGKEE